MKYNKYFLTLYIVVVLGLFFTSLLHRRSYQDTWILEGIFIPTMIFIFSFLIFEMFIDDNRLVALLGGSFVSILNLIPGLKYQLFYGCYDSVGHYGFVEELIHLGHVPQTGFYSQTYSDIPGMHIFISSLSLVSGIPVNEILRFIVPAMYGMFPLIIFFITKGIFSETVQRYIVIASSFPLVYGYSLSGTTFGLILYFLFIAVFLRRSFTNIDRVKSSVILIIIAFALMVSHGVTSFFLAALLMGATFCLEGLALAKRRFPSRSLVYGCMLSSSFFIVLLVAWWTFKADFYLSNIVDLVKKVFFVEPRIAPIPTRFFEISALAQLQILVVLHVKDIAVATISLLGLFALVRKLRQKELANQTTDFYFHLLLFLGFISTIIFLQLLLGFGDIEYRRFIDYAMVLTPFLAGMALWTLDRYLITVFRKIRIKNLVFASILFVLVSACLIQVFPYQPMVPKANVLSKDLPEEDYLIDLRMVNTIYQKEMIYFAARFSPDNAKITSDAVTRWQIYGLTDSSFSSRHIWHSPLSTADNVNLTWNLFLLHRTSKAAAFNEKAEYRTEKIIHGLRAEVGNNILYDNSESFIIASSNSSHIG